MPKKNTGYRLQWRPDREVWEIIWFDRGRRKRLSTGTTDRKRADKILAAHIENSQRRASTRLIGDILSDYQSERAPHISRPERIAQKIMNLAPFFGEMPFSDIKKSKCQEYYSQRKEEAQDGTIRGELGALRAALNHDYNESRIPFAPPVWLPEAPTHKDRWLTRKEAAKLLRASRKIANHLPWFILISLYSGQRKGAVLNLTWDRVDLERGLINWEYTKASKKRRPIQPMPDELRMFLGYLSGYGTDGPVLKLAGRKIKDIKRGFKSAMDAAGIKNASPHTLKHTAITWMMQNKTDLWSVAGFTGTSVKTLETVYAHHHPDYMEEARNSAKNARKRRLTAPNTAPKQAHRGNN